MYLESYLSANRDACPDHDPIPAYVERTFRKYLECGILAHGFTRVRKRVLCWMSRNGLLESTDAEEMLEWEHSGGFSVDGSVQLPGWDRQGLERAIESAGPSGAIRTRLEEASQKMGLTAQAEEQRTKKKAWAMLIARTYEVLPLLCPRCDAPMRIIAFVTEPATVTKILDHIGEPSTPEITTPARGPPQEEFAYNA